MANSSLRTWYAASAPIRGGQRMAAAAGVDRRDPRLVLGTRAGCGQPPVRRSHSRSTMIVSLVLFSLVNEASSFQAIYSSNIYNPPP